MAQFSHSRVETFKSCPYKFKLRYVDKIKALPNYDANNALLLGTAMHTGLEKGVEAAIEEYYGLYPIITDQHIEEAMKMEYLIPKAREVLPAGEYERMVAGSHFISFLDLLTLNEDGSYDLYDFKYSNNVANYMESGQLHEYKYFFESTTGKKIRKMFFVFIPKVQIKLKKTEDQNEFRKRIMKELETKEVLIKEVVFDYTKIIEFYEGIKSILEETDFKRNPTYFCNWCEYQDYCMKGIDYMISLPVNERRNIEKIEKKVIWIYGTPFSGKTTLANKFPAPLMLNTDGNIKFVDAPFLAMKDEVKVEGRQTKRTLAWEIFKDTINELEKKDNDFQTIIVDLLEDMYEHCRIFMYGKLGIEHESDNSFKAWDMVKTEFLSTLKRLMNMGYENIILISHEDTSKDITKKTGDKITSIRPNIQQKTDNKIAGMVDIVARVIADGEDRTLNFKSNEVIFGGGRLSVTDHVIPLEFEDFMKIFDEANANAKKKKNSRSTAAPTEEKKSGSKRSGRSKATDEPKKVEAEVVDQEPAKATDDDLKNAVDVEFKEVKDEPAADEAKADKPAGRSTRSSRSKNNVPVGELPEEKTETPAEETTGRRSRRSNPEEKTEAAAVKEPETSTPAGNVDQHAPEGRRSRKARS